MLIVDGGGRLVADEEQDGCVGTGCGCLMLPINLLLFVFYLAVFILFICLAVIFLSGLATS